MTEITSHMIRRYFRDECTEEETTAVRAWLLQHPDELEHHLTDDHWEQFETGEELPEEMSASMYGQIESQIKEKRSSHAERRSGFGRFGWRLPAVAAMLAAAVATWYLMRPADTATLTELTTAHPADKTDGYLENTTGKPLTHRLPDGSDVVLQPGATLQYGHPFVTDRRNITLSGKARFDVARHPAPFTVAAGKTSTTALGTVFEINSPPGKPTTVLLISGKVKVQAGKEKDVILRPGEQLKYDASLQTLQVSRPDVPDRKTPAVAQVPPKETIPTTAIIQFNNMPLTTIFRQLEAREKLQVLYDPALLKDRYFTGEYDSGKESLDNFLQTIAVLNNLQIRRSGDSLLISP